MARKKRKQVRSPGLKREPKTVAGRMIQAIKAKTGVSNSSLARTIGENAGPEISKICYGSNRTYPHSANIIEDLFHGLFSDEEQDAMGIPPKIPEREINEKKRAWGKTAAKNLANFNKTEHRYRQKAKPAEYDFPEPEGYGPPEETLEASNSIIDVSGLTFSEIQERLILPDHLIVVQEEQFETYRILSKVALAALKNF